MSHSIVTDCASAITREVVSRFNWDREEQMADAYHELLPVVRAGLLDFEHKLTHRARRLRPLGEPTTEREEAHDATE